MPKRSPITPEIRRFVHEHVHSVIQLELLLALHAEPDRVWSSDDLAQALRCPAAWVDAQIVDLARAGMVAVVEECDPLRFGWARSGSYAATVDSVAGVYKTHRTRIISLIYGRSRDLDDFSDAFRLRGDD